MTGTLKCATCGGRTRHALLREDTELRDTAEYLQLLALGDTPKRGDYVDLDRLRQEYRRSQPRNPYLRHRYWIAEAEQAWTTGHKKVTALCGEPITLKCDPNRRSTDSDEEVPGMIVARRLGDTEYEDPDTGLSWIDTDCVDCCRVSNNAHRTARREVMAAALVWLAGNLDRVPDEHVETLISVCRQSMRTKDADR